MDRSHDDYEAEDRVIGCLSALLVGLVLVMVIAAIVRGIA